MADDHTRLLGREINAALDRAITAPALPGAKSPITQRRGLLSRLRALEKAHGGPRAAAAEAGVHPETWSKWKRGKAKPSPRSLIRVDSAYQSDLARRGNTPIRRRHHAAQIDHQLMFVAARAEIQWDGYYNGQKRNPAIHPATARYAPYPDNAAARRRVDFGRLDLAPLARAWGRREETGRILEELLSADQAAVIFLNSYYRNPAVEIS